MRPIDVVQHVIFEGDFPRSLQFATQRVQRALAMLGPGAMDQRSHQAIVRLSEHLAHHTAETVFKGGLHEFLQGFLHCTAAFNEALQADYFATHVEA
jgi:uncharacterized alpha-E superfamily protein